MKIYVKPEIEITKLTAQDVLSASSDTQLDQDFIE